MVDGEHYPPVIEWALAEIGRQGDEVAAAVFLGGTEKVLENSGMRLAGYPVVTDTDPLAAIGAAIERFNPDAVVDLSDEPVVGYKERFAIASLVLSAGITYRGADFELRPPVLEKLSTKPSLGIIGTGKRVGKTAVSAYACRELKAAGFNPAVVAMGRGGPAEPEVIRGDEISIDASYLLAQAAEGRHAASDHFEDALMSRIPTVGCRRCGGGLAGRPFVSNVRAGELIANELDTGFTIFEGSGAAIPPVATDAVLTVAGATQPVEYITGYLGPLRLLMSDLVVLTNCEDSVEQAKIETIIEGMGRIKPGLDVVKTVFRPLPLEDISGKKVFFATTAPETTNEIFKDYLETQFDARVAGISHHLSNRPKLRQDLAAGGDFDLLLTELKAAAVDVVTAVGMELGKPVVYCDNVPVALEEKPLGDNIIGLARRAAAGFRGEAS